MTIIQVMTARSVADAKAHFAACLREAERGEPVTILRHGKPVAVLVSAVEWERRQAAAGAAAAPNALAAIASRLGEGGQALYEAGMAAYQERRRGLPNRPLPEIDD